MMTENKVSKGATVGKGSLKNNSEKYPEVVVMRVSSCKCGAEREDGC